MCCECPLYLQFHKMWQFKKILFSSVDKWLRLIKKKKSIFQLHDPDDIIQIWSFVRCIQNVIPKVERFLYSPYSSGFDLTRQKDSSSFDNFIYSHRNITISFSICHMQSKPGTSSICYNSVLGLGLVWILILKEYRNTFPNVHICCYTIDT